MAAVAATTAALTAIAAPYEDYRMQIQRVQDAKLKEAPRTGAMGGMHEHMAGMEEMNRQLQEARAVDQMSPEQMRNWITQHVRLMDQMHRQMTGDRAPMGDHSAPRPAR